jgi:hypothetical protein
MGSYAASRKRRIRSCPEAASERFLFSLALYRQVDDRETLSAECVLSGKDKAADRAALFLNAGCH